MKVRYTIKKDAVIRRIIMRLELVEGISCSHRFFDRTIVLDTDDNDDVKIILLINTLDLVEKIDMIWSDKEKEKSKESEETK